MDQPSATPSSKGENGVWRWFIGFLALLLFSLVLGWFDDSTELQPDHNSDRQACFAIAGLCGLAAALLSMIKLKGTSMGRRVGLSLNMGLVGFGSVFLTMVHTMDIVRGVVDFPVGKTISYSKVLSISRAYQTHGKGRSWRIQTAPIWSDLDITEFDYKYMLAHRRTGDNPSDPDRTSSRGYFCARVTVEESGNALRVLHAGSHKLPKGTVVICPVGGSN